MVYYINLVSSKVYNSFQVGFIQLYLYEFTYIRVSAYVVGWFVGCTRKQFIHIR